jgi:peptidoglycan/xylan/chitin deacetylase (PgdA/CDA1 family)
MYHAVGSPVLGDARGIFGISPASFDAHMAALSRFLQHENACISDGRMLDAAGPALQVAITFDDGYADNLDTALPILERYDFPCTIFAVSEFVRAGRPPFISPAGLRELSTRRGVTIGAHGANHLALTHCDDGALRNELVSAKHQLEDITGKPVIDIAYPYGAVNQRVRAAAGLAGYLHGFTSHFDINQERRDQLLMARTSILGTDDTRVFTQKLRGNWDWYRWRSTDPAAI